jgi:hypothetical protein
MYGSLVFESVPTNPGGNHSAATSDEDNGGVINIHLGHSVERDTKIIQKYQQRKKEKN